MEPTLLLIVSNFTTGVVLFFTGWFIGQKAKQVDIFKYIVGAGVIGVWIYRLLISSQNATIILSVWEHIMTGLVVYSLWGAKSGEKNSFVDLILYKITGLKNAEPRTEN